MNPLLAITIIFVPTISFAYSMVFMFIAFIKMLIENDKKNILYFILFALIFMPPGRLILSYQFPATDIPFNLPWYYNNPEVPFSAGFVPIESVFNTVIAVLCLFALYLHLAADAIRDFVSGVRESGFKKYMLGILRGIFPFNKMEKQEEKGCFITK
jgi:branched-subunit amino acid ABC-type transport system permease component